MVESLIIMKYLMLGSIILVTIFIYRLIIKIVLIMECIGQGFSTTLYFS